MGDKIKCNPVTFGGSTKEGSPYWTFKQKIKDSFNKKIDFDDEVELEIVVYLLKERIKPGKNDLDNFLKPIIDAIEGILFNSESQISSIYIKRIGVDLKDEEGIRVLSKIKDVYEND